MSALPERNNRIRLNASLNQCCEYLLCGALLSWAFLPSEIERRIH